MKISVLTPSLRPKGLAVIQHCLGKQTFTDFEWLVEMNWTGKHDLNAAFNRMIRRSEGELLIFLEDYTRILDDGLERFWRAYQEHPDTLFTAPLGKVYDWGEKPTWDWRATKQREDQADYTDCLPRCCELDWGAIPRKILYEIGGFDEELDKYWSGDNVSIGIRADLAGYKFKCVFTNPAVAWDHDAHLPHPFREKYNPRFQSERLDAFRAGLTINYLDK